MALPEFEPFQKIPRLSRNMIITEKIDGTNAQIYIPNPGSDDELEINARYAFPLLAGSRNRWLLPQGGDNFGFGAWVYKNAEALKRLGYGHHYGEWWGQGIQRGYGLTKKRFSLFNVHKWSKGLPEGLPDNVDVVPVLDRYTFDTERIQHCLEELAANGSKAAPGFTKPEGIVIYHVAAGQIFKKTIEADESPKGAVEDA